MAVSAHALRGVRTTSGPSGLTFEAPYIVLDADDEDAARAAVILEAPEDYQAVPIGDVSIEEVGYRIYTATVRYASSVRDEAPPEAGEDPGPEGNAPGAGNPAGGASGAEPMGREWSLSTGGGTRHITRSLETINSYAAPGRTAPNFKGLIGVSEDGVAGVDILAAEPTIRVSLRFAQITLGYFLRVCAMTPSVNRSPWQGFAQGELLFAGGEMNYRDGDAWSVSFEFKYSPNEYGFKVGDIMIDYKWGWDYLWVAYEQGTNANKIVQTPYAAYVEAVYKFSDFNKLGI